MAGGRRGRDGGGLDPGSEAAPAGDSGQASLSEAEFDALMRTHFNDIWRYALRRTATPEDADDVTAEVFATLWRRRDSLPPRPEMRLWLYGVARNVVSNQHRSGRRRARLEARMNSQPHPALPSVEAKDDVLWRAIATLSDSDHDLLVMRAQDGLPVADIAKVLGCSRTAVSLRLRRARQRLRAALDAIEGPTGQRAKEAEKPTEITKHRGRGGHVAVESGEDGRS